MISHLAFYMLLILDILYLAYCIYLIKHPSPYVKKNWMRWKDALMKAIYWEIRISLERSLGTLLKGRDNSLYEIKVDVFLACRRNC